MSVSSLVQVVIIAIAVSSAMLDRVTYVISVKAVAITVMNVKDVMSHVRTLAKRVITVLIVLHVLIVKVV